MKVKASSKRLRAAVSRVIKLVMRRKPPKRKPAKRKAAKRPAKRRGRR